MDNKGFEVDKHVEADIKLSDVSVPTITDDTDRNNNDNSGDGFKTTQQIWRNTLVVCVGFLFLFVYYGLEALQSSFFIHDGMGTTVLATIYACAIFSMLFLATPALSYLGCKWTFVISMSCYVFFMAAHFYAVWELFLPAAVIVGLAVAPLWTAQGQYLNTAAHEYAKLTTMTHEGAANLFFGVFFFCFQLSCVVGHLVSSQVLSPIGTVNASLITPYTPEELSFCGAGFCPSDAQSSNNTNLNGATDRQLHILAGSFIACGCVAAFMIAMFLQPLPAESAPKLRCTRDMCKSIYTELTTTFIQLRKPTQLLLIPLTAYTGMQQAFIAGDYTQAFITCPLGSWWVGYILTCHGICDAICSFTFGRLVSYVGRIPFFILGAVINLSLLIVFLLFEMTQDQLYIYFIFAGLWGVADAVWQTQVSALYGVLFKEDGEAAFTNCRLWESVGFSAAFIYQSRLCFPIKAYILIAVLVIGMVCYSTVEVRERRNHPSHQ